MIVLKDEQGQLLVNLYEWLHAAATQAHSSHLRLVAIGFSLLKVIVAAAINRSNMVTNKKWSATCNTILNIGG